MTSSRTGTRGSGGTKTGMTREVSTCETGRRDVPVKGTGEI